MYPIRAVKAKTSIARNRAQNRRKKTTKRIWRLIIFNGSGQTMQKLEEMPPFLW